jgi:hypothetical protein
MPRNHTVFHGVEQEVDMPVKVKTANSLAKDLTDVPVAVPKLTGAGMHDDPFMAIASKIEKVSSLEEVEKIAKASVDGAGFNCVVLGGAVVRAMELFPTAKSEVPECKSSRDYIERVLGVDYSTAMRAAQVSRKILELNVPYSAFQGIGWSKILKLLQIVNKENIAEWVEKAKTMNVLSLDAAIKAAKAPKALEQAPAEPKTITTKTFKLHEDQKQLVQDGLKKASEETGSAVEAVNLEAVFQNYMGGGLAFADVAQAMAYAAKHTNDAALFVQKQIAMMEELFPQLSIAVEITFKETPPAA